MCSLTPSRRVDNSLGTPRRSMSACATSSRALGRAFAHHNDRSRSSVIANVGTGRFVVGGNWKCNGTALKVKELIAALNEGKIADNVDVVVAPPTLYISEALKTLKAPYQVAAQNCWVEDFYDPTHHYDSNTGAFTGEISAEMLEDMKVPWVVLGHSERRAAPFFESNSFVGKKVAHARFHGLNVIVCVGESLQQRQEGRALEVIFEQLQAIADEIDDREHSSWGSQVVIAYEPIWAIGTGVVATPEQAQEIHAGIRKWLAENVSQEVSKATRIQYGGSVNADNCVTLAKYSDIDGFLVGGASLNGEAFVKICNSSVAHYKAVGRL